MANAFATNYVPLNSNEKFNIIWKLSRVLLASGWRYKASSNGSTKDTSNSANNYGGDQNDYWQVNGYEYNTTTTGSSNATATIGVGAFTASTGLLTIGAVTGYTANSVGHALTISGAASAGNNGTFRIVSQTGTTVTVYNPSGVSSDANTGSITATEKYGGGGTGVSITAAPTFGGTTLNSMAQVSGLSNMVQPNASTTVASGSNGVSISGATSISMASTANFSTQGSIVVLTTTGYQTVNYTGVSGGNTFTGCSTSGTGNMATGNAVYTSYPGSVGHRLTITGASNSGNNGTFIIMNWVSATSVIIYNPGAVTESTNANLTWTEYDPNKGSYPLSIQASSGIGAWICLQGPSTLKVPIGAATPAFIRGENVTQTTSGATAEVIGISTDTTGAGFLVLGPRVYGSGAGVRGWSNSATITGAVSGATVSPTSTIVEYIREWVWWKGSASTGHTYMQCIDSVGESTETALVGRFSHMATLSGCTATIAPGGATSGSPTTNGFPTNGTWCCVGTGGSGAGATGAIDFFNTSISIATGHSQIMCASNIEGVQLAPNGTGSVGVTADGSWLIASGTPGTGTTTFVGVGYQRVDDCEQGDIDPYVGYFPNAAETYSRARAGVSTTHSNGDLFQLGNMSDNNSTQWIGFRGRGFLSGDNHQEFAGYSLHNFSGDALNTNTGTSDNVSCNPATIKNRQPIWIVSAQANQKMRKGTLRWIYAVLGGAGTNTYDTLRWVQLSSTNAPIIAGPYDQLTTPSN
jgi:hypothetical protein